MKPPVVAKPFPDVTVVENRQGDRYLPNVTGTDKSSGTEIFCETDKYFDESEQALGGGRDP